MLRAAVMLSFLAALGLPGRLLAHEGHQHKVMGTVVQVHADKVSHVEVKTTDGKTVVLTCDDQTKFLKGVTAASLKDVKAGSRISATVTTEGTVTKASEIVIGAGGAAAPVTTPAPAASPTRPREPEGHARIRAWLQAYDTAFNTRDIQRLAPFYHPDVTIFEGGSTNDGWADYRDNHLGPELREMEGLQFSHVDVAPHVLSADGRTAYVTGEYRIKARIGERDVDAAGLETLVLVKDAAGAWKIRHSHTSSRKRPVLAAPQQP